MLKNQLQNARLAPFLGGSILCAGINNVILIAGEFMGFGYFLLTFICYATSGSVGYLYHCKITFDQPMTVSGYINFIATLSLGLPVSLMLLAIMVDGLNLPMWFAAPAMTLIMFVYHYFIARLTILSAPKSLES